MIRPFTRWNGFCFLQVGLVALLVDCSLFLLTLSAGWSPLLAAAFGYAAGALVHYALCNKAVFADLTATVSQLRDRQQMMFAIAAIVGLAVTLATIPPLIAMDMAPVLAKLLGAITSFGTTLLIRCRMLLVA